MASTPGCWEVVICVRESESRAEALRLAGLAIAAALRDAPPPPGVDDPHVRYIPDNVDKTPTTRVMSDRTCPP